MKRLLLLPFLLICCFISEAKKITVKNIEELNLANKQAVPGDTILFVNGEWKDVLISLNASGTSEKPIVFKAAEPGKVKITGHSRLRLGGSYLVVDGLYFTNGYGGGDVIDFHIDKNQLANHCRVTNCVVNDFNNPRRMDENYWVVFFGKNNRLDHCSFINKKNMGVLLAVILDDERSRENFHSIDHNYFGQRIPLASNSGEIIRVGVSQHCQFNSNTQIVDNFFEHCDGETEIVSIKSGSNVVRNNLFKECQGGVVLRHGDNNTVENNIFLGNNKEGTGGVRVINKGQWVVNNFFYKCRGVDFRSPLSIMNGIPNSPANRYVQVTDAVIANNTFYNCSAASFCEGSDKERTLPPANVALLNNIFYNTLDTIIYRAFDNISGFSFSGNEVSVELKQEVVPGFIPISNFIIKKTSVESIPVSSNKQSIPDSLQEAAKARLGHRLSDKAGFMDLQILNEIQTVAYKACGAKWFEKISTPAPTKFQQVSCNTAEEIYKQLERKEAVTIKLTGTSYNLDKPFIISKPVKFIGDGRTPISFKTPSLLSVFLIAGNGNLTLEKLVVNGGDIKAGSFISSDSMGSSNHYNLSIQNCTVRNFDRQKGCQNLFYAFRHMVADSLAFRNNYFANNNCNGIMLADEKEDKGYYNAEKLLIGHNRFEKQNGIILNIYRGGNDESTMGPNLYFSHNRISDCSTTDGSALLMLTGVQQTRIFSNQFLRSNPSANLITYKDTVRARHWLEKNTITSSGSVAENGFVMSKENTIQ